MRLLLPIALPALLAVLAWRVRGTRAQLAILLAGAGLHAALTASLFAWPAAPTALLSLDPLGRLFLGITTVVFAACALYSVSYLTEGTHDAPARLHRFVPVLLAFLAAMSLVTLTHHLAVLWAGVEATTLATAPLISFYRRPQALEATWKYLLLCSVGIALALLGTFALGIAAANVPGGASLTVDGLRAAAPHMARPWLKAAFVLALVGYGTKMGLAPLHTWLPDAHSQAPSPVSALLSGVVLNGAFLGILRFHEVAIASGDAAFARTLLVLLGLVSLAVAAAFLIGQRDYKRLLAYSSVENMGVLAVGVGVGGAAAGGALLHAVNHSIAKAGLFLLAGNVLRAYGTTAAAEVRGVARRLPATGVLLAALLLAIGGLPPFGPFFSELTVFQAAVAGPSPWIGVLLVALLAAAFLGMAGVLVPMLQPGPGERPGVLRERRLAVLPPLALAAASLWLGLRLPAPLARLLAEAAARIGGAP